MSWPTPQYSRKAVSRAGEILAGRRKQPNKVFEAFEILTNWRACHGYPINTFKVTMRDKLNRIGDDYLVAQRLKRLPSIVAKLRRIQGMNLARMQDIGGLRAVVSDTAIARELRSSYRRSKFAHRLVTDTDYILTPKPSGYRGFHLVYRYEGSRTSDYDGLQLELQIRTKVQHAWATAVETAGTFLNQSLKASEGPEKWLDFFSLVSAGFALQEREPPGERWSQMSEKDIERKIVTESRTLNIREKLGAYRVALDAIRSDRHRGSYHLIVLNPSNQTVEITSYSKDRLDSANRDYASVESEIKDSDTRQAVLVSASSLDQLQRAYPNYFLDTQEFLNMLDGFN